MQTHAVSKTSTQEEKHHKFLISFEKWLNQFYVIDKKTCDKLWCICSHSGILNGLAKVENQSFNNCEALRTIFPVIGTSTYSIAKFRVFSFSNN